MAGTISNISIVKDTTPVNTEAIPLSQTEELRKINKIKYNLSLLYFAGLAILMTTLFL